MIGKSATMADKNTGLPLTSQRIPEKMSSQLEELHELLQTSILAHIGLQAFNRSMVFPTAFAVVENEIIIHGSTGSRWMRALVGQPATVEVTKLDAIVVARSTFESSVRYRSAMMFGEFSPVAEDRKSELLNAFSDRLIPGRSQEVRPSTKKEIAATEVLSMQISEWSLRISDGWPDDEPSDIAGDAWAGVVVFETPQARIESAPDLREGIPVPTSVQELAAHPERFI